MPTHVVHRDVVSDLLNELSEKLYALKNAYSAEVARNEQATKRTKNDNRKKLGAPEVASIRRLYDMGWTQSELADAFAVNPATISRTVRGIYHSTR
jgi:DNA-binding MarR family transcriptional regulator